MLQSLQKIRGHCIWTERVRLNKLHEAPLMRRIEKSVMTILELVCKMPWASFVWIIIGGTLIPDVTWKRLNSNSKKSVSLSYASMFYVSIFIEDLRTLYSDGKEQTVKELGLISCMKLF